MKFKTYTGITWSTLELTGLLEDEDSCVYFEKFKKHLGLHPFHLTNLTAALNEILSSNLNSYDTDLKGFLLAYKNPKLLTPLGEILYDTCFIHIDIEADFYVFRPSVGRSLKGIVNKKGLDHIGVLVHKAFNVSIPKPDNEEYWPGDNLEIGQEVRFVITVLDFTSKLPFIRGVLNPDDYLQGCRIMETSVNTCNARVSFDDDTQDNVDNTVNRISEKSVKHSKQCTFSATDSENASEEDIPQIKKENVKQKKMKKKSKQEELIEHNEDEEGDKKYIKRTKVVKETKPKFIKVGTMQAEYMDHTSMNGEFQNNEELEESMNSKNKSKKRSKGHSSQSSIDENVNEKPGKHLSKKTSKKLPNIEPKDGISNIKLEQSRSSDLEGVAEEHTFENKIKLQKNLTKYWNLNNSDNSADEFSPEKYIKGSSKKSSKTNKTSLIGSEETPANIKMENLNDVGTNSVTSEIEGSPSKKKPKKRKSSMKLETSENEVDRNFEEISVKKHPRKSSISDSEFAFQNIRIKTEKIADDSEDVQNKNYVKTNKISKIDTELNMSACSSNYNFEEDNEYNVTKKKRKKHAEKLSMETHQIKTEPEFEDITIKLEKPGNKNNIVTEDIYQKNDVNSMLKINSPKKKHKVNLDKEPIEKETKVHGIEVKMESSTNNVLDSDSSNTNVQSSERKKKHVKNSSNKQLSKSKRLESEFNFSDIQIKTERFTDN